MFYVHLNLMKSSRVLVMDSECLKAKLLQKLAENSLRLMKKEKF